MGIFSKGCQVALMTMLSFAVPSRSLLSGITVDIDYENTLYIESTACVECMSAGLSGQTYAVELTMNTTAAAYSPSSFCMTVYECFFSGASLLKVNISSANDSYTTSLVPAFLADLSLAFDSNFTFGRPCNLTASVSTGAGVTFAINISHAQNSTLLMMVIEPSNVTSKQAALCFVPPYLGNFTIFVEATASCGQKLNRTHYQWSSPPDPPLSVSIVGGSLRQAKINSVVNLDALSGFSNGDTATPTNTAGFSFSWACYRLSSSADVSRYTQPYNNDTSYKTLPACNVTVPAAGIVNVSTSSFAVNDFALFEVTVRNKEQTGVAAQAISVLSTQPPIIDISCILNCDHKVIQGERTKFTAVIKECAECKSPNDMLDARYRWSISRHDRASNTEVVIPENSWGSLITSPPDSNTLDIDGGWFLEGNTYTIMLSINLTNLPEAKAVKSVFTNLKPYNGTCSVEPKEGTASVTQFIFKFIGWKDEGANPYQDPLLDSNAGLQYQVYQETLSVTQIIYSKGNSTSEGIYLSECVGTGNICNLTAFIIDIYKAKTTCFIPVKVSAVTLTISSNSTQAEESLQTSMEFIEQLNQKVNISEDPLTAVKRAALFTMIVTSIADGATFTQQSISSVGSMDLNPPEKNPASQALIEAANNFVDKIGETISGATIKDPVHLQTYANSLATATSNQKYISAQSVSTASSALTILTGIFQKKDLKIAEVTPTLNGFKDLINNIIGITAIDFSDLKPDLKSIKNDKSDLSGQEVAFYAQLKADYQKIEKRAMIEQADKTVRDLKQAWDDIFKVVKKLQDSNNSFETKKETFTLQTVQTTRSDLTKVLPVVSPESSQALPKGMYVADVLVNNDKEVLQAQTVETKNIYIHGSNSQYITSNVFIGSVATENGTKQVIVKPQIVHRVKENNCSNERQVLDPITPHFILEDAARMFYHAIEYPNPILTLCFKVRPESSLISYTLFLRMGSEPTDLSYDLRTKLTKEMIGPCGEVCFPPKTFKTSGRIYIGLKPELDEKAKTQSNSSIQNRKKRDALYDSLESMYLFGVTTLACFAWDTTINDWNPDLCKMTSLNGSILCTCKDGREIVNGVSFNFQPSTIHFGTVFSKFDIQGQGLIIGVLLAIYFLFLLTALWAHYMDRKSVFQWGVFPLTDNYAEDNYFYLLTVHTGLRHSAGTKSKVNFCLSGEQDETGVRILSDGVREGFPAGSVYHFVMACPMKMGELQCLRIWHDNSGKGNSASWFLDRVDVMDIQTGRVSYFVCEEWLTPENNSLDKMIEASGADSLDNIKSQFFSNTKQHITDDHLWVSLFIRPERSRFSRVERAGCCLAFFLLAMITSAMFYVGAPDVNRKITKVDFEMGPIRLKYQQLYFSFVSATITAIPLILIMMIFRKAKTRMETDICNNVKHELTTKKNSKSKVTPSEASYVKTNKKTGCCTPPWMHKLETQLTALDKIMMLKPGLL